MSDIEIIKLVFGIFLSIGGVVLLLLSYLIGYKYLVMEKRCTAKVKGIIKKYTLASRGGENNGIHLPVVFYNVDGKDYKVVGPVYKSYITTNKITPFGKNEMNYSDDNQVLKVSRSSNLFAGIYKNPIQELYPLGSEIDVFYDPKNPKLSYVLRYCNNKWQFWLLFIGGLITLIMDIALLILL